MDIEQVLPHVLRCLDTNRLGPRKVAMLELVYIQQGGKRVQVPLGDKDLMRLTRRSANQISYDRRALAELVEMKMLRKVRGTGSIANAYSLREPRLWDSGRIRWLGPKERIVSFFWALQPRDLFDLSRDDAGQLLFFRATGLHRYQTPPRETAGHDVVIARGDRAALGTPPRGEFGDSRSDRTPHRAETPPAVDGPHTVLMASKEALVKNLDEEEERRLREEAKAIGRRIATSGGLESKTLFGAPLDTVIETVAAHLDHISELYTLAVTVPKGLGAPQLAECFKGLADDAAAAGWPHPFAAQIAGLEREIRTVEDFNADDDVILPRLYAELAELQLGIAGSGHRQAVGFGS